MVERRAGDEAMRRAIRSLGLRERQAVYLRYFEDLSFAETARIMRARQGTIRVLVFRALGKMRRELASSRESDQVAI
jgi:RNA polymerase sigma factor (sigma-70 family)